MNVYYVLFGSCYFSKKPHIRLLVGRFVGWLACHISQKKAGKLHLLACSYRVTCFHIHTRELTLLQSFIDLSLP